MVDGGNLAPHRIPQLLPVFRFIDYLAVQDFLHPQQGNPILYP